MADKTQIKRDVILLLALIAVGLVFVALFFIRSGNGNRVVVSVDTQTEAEYDLAVDGEYVIQGVGDGYNVLVIENGQAFVREASCPDHLCMNMGHISKVGESIICLPNKVVISIVSNNEQSDYDAISR